MEQNPQEETISLVKELQSSVEKIAALASSNPNATKSDVERVFQLNQTIVELLAEQSQSISNLRSLILATQNQNEGGLA